MKTIDYGTSQALHSPIGRNIAVHNRRERNQIIPVFAAAVNAMLGPSLSATCGLPTGIAKARPAAGRSIGSVRPT